MHSPDIRQKFIELRAAAHSIAKISSLLSVAPSTLRLWEKDDALEIARLRRIHWEDAEDRVGITLENRLRRMAEWINGAENELEKRHFDLMNNRDLMRFLRESRREYFRLRAMLFSAENTLERTRQNRPKAPRRAARNSNTADPESNPSDLDPLPLNPPRQQCEPTHNHNLNLNPHPDPAPSRPCDNSPTVLPVCKATGKIGELADFPTTPSRPTNDLQQSESTTSHSPITPELPPDDSGSGAAMIQDSSGLTSSCPVDNQVASEPAAPTHNHNLNPDPDPPPSPACDDSPPPLINTPLQRGEPTEPTTALAASPSLSSSNSPENAHSVAAGVSPASEPGVSPGDPNPIVTKKHKPYWLNGHYYPNPEYPEHIARAICARPRSARKLPG